MYMYRLCPCGTSTTHWCKNLYTLCCGGHLICHKQFLCRYQWRGITSLVDRSQVTTHIRCVLCWPDGRRRIMATATTAFIPNVDVLISYRWLKFHPSSHRLCLVTELEQAGYRRKSCHSRNSIFSHNRPTLAGYVVHNQALVVSKHFSEAKCSP
jgi:hypothetical protein